jgi:hypothetical protein
LKHRGILAKIGNRAQSFLRLFLLLDAHAFRVLVSAPRRNMLSESSLVRVSSK